MKKLYVILILLIVFIVVFSMNFVNIPLNFNPPETTLLKSFSNSGAKVVSSEMYFWAKVEDSRYDNFESLKELALNFSEELGIAGNRDFTQDIVENDMLQEIQINGILPVGVLGNERIISVNAQLAGKRENTGEKFISVDVVQDLSIEGLNNTRRKIEEVYRKYGIAPRINTCITGSYDGKLTYEQMEDICRLIFKGAGAVKVEGMRDRNLISVSAYSPAISDYIRVKESRVNLNLALRYNSYEDKTYLWLATPVITTEY